MKLKVVYIFGGRQVDAIVSINGPMYWTLEDFKHGFYLDSGFQPTKILENKEYWIPPSKLEYLKVIQDGAGEQAE